MHLNRRNLVIMTILAIGGNGIEGGQNAIDQLQPLVEASVHRLDVAEQVAFAKWDSKAKVEDAPREAQVIMDAVKEGESAGLDRTFVANFFRAKIEANKVVQYALLADWYRAGGAPAHGPANLTTGIRPKLDRLQTELVGELVDTISIRVRASCHADIVMAIGKYLSTHKYDPARRQAIVLDRALATACTYEP
jgi:chorismate mutase